MNSATGGGGREGSLEAPTRHPLDWREPAFYDEAALEQELQRVFDICHGCRRCFSLCQSFPTCSSRSMPPRRCELDGVDKQVYWEVVEHCYLCDMCYMTKCPYVPPHPWNVDFPHLMLRAKAVRARARRAHAERARCSAPTDAVGRIAGIPVVAEIVNAANRSARRAQAAGARRSASTARAAAQVSFDAARARRLDSTRCAAI